jgi:N-acetylglucosaminyldiphosphoundecaprenol N-acetyl-beta-D-mannosaminyltransferase
MSFSRVSLFGFQFTAATSIKQVVTDIMLNAARGFDGKTQFLVTPNASTTVYYSENKYQYLKQHYSSSTYVLADGMPIVWTSKLKGENKLQARLTGSDLFPQLWNELKRDGYSATLVLPNTTLGDLFLTEYNKCSVLIPEYFSPDDEQYITAFASDVADAIISNQSSFLFLGLNFPKQEKLGIAVAKELEKRNYPRGILILLLGASFEFYFGLKKRAPVALQRLGLEWLYRFASEPKRLARRYTVDNVRFLSMAVRELFG